VGRIESAQEAEAVLQDFQHAFAVDAAAGARVRLQHQEDDVLLARARDAFLDAEALGQREQVGGALALEFVEIDQRTVAAAVLRLVVLLVVIVRRTAALLVAAAAVAATIAAPAAPAALVRVVVVLRLATLALRRRRAGIVRAAVGGCA